MNEQAKLRSVRLLSIGCLLVLLACLGCSDSSDVGTISIPVGVTNADMTGTWSFVSGDPPQVSGCTGELQGYAQNLMPTFTAILEQIGTSVTGTLVGACIANPLGSSSASGGVQDIAMATSVQDCSRSAMSIEATVDGNSVAGSMMTTLNGVVYRVNFDGSVDLDIAMLTATGLVADGMSGSCTVSGGYVATR